MEKEQLIMLFAGAIINELVRRVASFIAKKLKTISVKRNRGSMVGAAFNRFLIVAVFQFGIFLAFVFTFVGLSQLNSAVTNQSVAWMIVLFCLTLRVGYNFLKAIRAYREYTISLAGKYDVQTRNATNA